MIAFTASLVLSVLSVQCEQGLQVSDGGMVLTLAETTTLRSGPLENKPRVGPVRVGARRYERNQGGQLVRSDGKADEVVSSGQVVTLCPLSPQRAWGVVRFGRTVQIWEFSPMAARAMGIGELLVEGLEALGPTTLVAPALRWAVYEGIAAVAWNRVAALLSPLAQDKSWLATLVLVRLSQDERRDIRAEAMGVIADRCRTKRGPPCAIALGPFVYDESVSVQAFARERLVRDAPELALRGATVEVKLDLVAHLAARLSQNNEHPPLVALRELTNDSDPKVRAEARRVWHELHY